MICLQPSTQTPPDLSGTHVRKKGIFFVSAKALSFCSLLQP